MKHVARTTIDAPADLVWHTIADVAHWADWTPTVTSITRHDPGDLREGSVADVAQPKQPLRKWTVTSLTPGADFVWETTSAGLRMVAGHAVSTTSGHTEVELTFEVTGLLGPMASLLAGKQIRTAVDTECASLKAWCESR